MKKESKQDKKKIGKELKELDNTEKNNTWPQSESRKNKRKYKKVRIHYKH